LRKRYGKSTKKARFLVLFGFMTVKQLREKILNRALGVLNLEEDLKKQILSDDLEKEVTDFEPETLGGLVSLEFVKNDPEIRDTLHKQWLGGFMPDFEKAQLKVLLDSLGQTPLVESKARIVEAWKDPNHQRTNQRLFAAMNEMLAQVSDAAKKSGKGPEELKEKYSEVVSRLNALQEEKDTFEERLKSTREEEAAKWEKDFVKMSLIQEAQKRGAKFPRDKFREYWAKEMLDSATWKRTENGLEVRQKENPDLRLTDPETGQTLTASQYLEKSLSDFIEKQPTPPQPPAGGESGKDPKEKFTLPDGVQPGSRRALQLQKIAERRAAQNRETA
jgi:Txe/YoeB family toxin of Txe-Axe toxin-antitoxin module